MIVYTADAAIGTARIFHRSGVGDFQTTRCGLAIAWMVATNDAASWYAGLGPCPDCWPDGYRADARGDEQNAR